MKPKVVLAFSGGLDTCVILHWLTKKGYQVVCFVADVGQKEDFESVKEKALKIGAHKVVVSNLQQEFVEDYVFEALKANATYEDFYLLGTALARPLIAKKQVEIAQQEGAGFLAHGATGKGNDQVRFELVYASLFPDATVISPWKDQGFISQFSGRSDLLAYAALHELPVVLHGKKNPYSIDENLIHTSFEGESLEKLDTVLDEKSYLKTMSVDDAKNNPTNLKITFEQGIPVSVVNLENQVTVTDAVGLVAMLNQLGGAAGVGRIDIIENRFIGIKSRGVYEAPAATILKKAHQEIESLTLDKQVKNIKQHLELQVAQTIYNGLWFSPEMNFLMAAIDQSQKNVCGEITLQLYKGNVLVLARFSKFSLYCQQISSMDSVASFDQQDARGFINIQSLRLKNLKEIK